MSELPVGSLRDAIPHLRRPFTAGAVKWKIQTVKGDRAMIVGFIDARLVVERLNAVIPDRWSEEHERIDPKHMLCRLTIDGVTHEDVGEVKGSVKGLYSDALKRTAVRFGVGVSLYALPALWVPAKAVTAGISAEQERNLRERYRAWLGAEGRRAFGEALDHGDPEEGSVGDPDESAPRDSSAHEAPEAGLAALAGTVRAAWESLPEAGKKRLRRAQLESMLGGATTAGELEAIAAHVEGLRVKGTAKEPSEVRP